MSTNKFEDVHEKPASLTINKEDYCLLEIPDKSSKKVQEIVCILKQDCNINLDAFHKTEFLKCALYLASVYGNVSDMKLKMKITEALLDILKLVGDSIFELNGFCRTSRTILNASISAYEYLLDGFKEEAMKSLAFIDAEYKSIKEVAMKLKTQIECCKILKLTDDICIDDLSQDQYKPTIKSLHQVQDNILSMNNPMEEILQLYETSYLKECYDRIITAIEATKEKNKEAQHKIWISETFKKEILDYQCYWVAFAEIFSSFSSAMKEFEENIRKCIHVTSI